MEPNYIEVWANVVAEAPTSVGFALIRRIYWSGGKGWITADITFSGSGQLNVIHDDIPYPLPGFSPITSLGVYEFEAPSGMMEFSVTMPNAGDIVTIGPVRIFKVSD